MPKAIKDLIHGYQAFHKDYFTGTHSIFEKLVRQGQRPKVLVVACSDSRVDPALVLNCEPGDLFVVRNVANLIPPYENDHHYHGTSAALEFGIQVLGIRHIVVFGHSECGGISSLFEPECKIKSTESFVTKWMELARGAHESVLAKHPQANVTEQIEYCCQAALLQSIANLNSFPWIQEKVANKNLFLHAWYFNLKTGLIQAFDEKQNRFKELSSLF
jgi:carbonic anhydrase